MFVPGLSSFTLVCSKALLQKEKLKREAGRRGCDTTLNGPECNEAFMSERVISLSSKGTK